MRLEPTPTPTVEQADAVAKARRVLDDARRQGRSTEAIALSFAAFSLACREASVVEPPPLAQWPGATPDSRPARPGPARTDPERGGIIP